MDIDSTIANPKWLRIRIPREKLSIIYYLYTIQGKPKNRKLPFSHLSIRKTIHVCRVGQFPIFGYSLYTYISYAFKRTTLVKKHISTSLKTHSITCFVRWWYVHISMIQVIFNPFFVSSQSHSTIRVLISHVMLLLMFE